MRLALLTAAVAAATAVALPLPVPVLAQGTPQTVQLTKVDVVKVATGFRASKIIGSSVVNEAGDTVGKVDDVIIGEDRKVAVRRAGGGRIPRHRRQARRAALRAAEDHGPQDRDAGRHQGRPEGPARVQICVQLTLAGAVLPGACRSSRAPAFSRAERTTVDRPASHSTETSIGPDSSGLPCFSTPGWPLSTSAPAGQGTGRVRRSARADEDVGAFDAVFLDEMLDGRLGIATGIEVANDGSLHGSLPSVRIRKPVASGRRSGCRALRESPGRTAAAWATHGV